MVTNESQARQTLENSLDGYSPSPLVEAVGRHSVALAPAEETETPFVSSIDCQTIEAINGSTLRGRSVNLEGYIDSQLAETVVNKIGRLNQEDPESGIYLLINSPGGKMLAGLEIRQAMQTAEADIYTVAVGYAASIAVGLLIHGTVGKRWLLDVDDDSGVALHNPRPITKANNLEEAQLIANKLTGQQARKLRKRTAEMIESQLYRELATLTNLDHKVISELAAGNLELHLDAEGAKEAGIVDHVLSVGTNRQDAR